MTNYFVERGAVLLAALRLWAEPRQETDGDLRALIDSASARTLVIIARELAESHSPDELHASVQLEGIAYEPRRQLSDTLDFARKGPSTELRERGRLIGLMPWPSPR
jgi:hypothetical protein